MNDIVNYIIDKVENYTKELIDKSIKKDFTDIISEIESTSKYDNKTKKFTITFKITGKH